jgi:hypothetical protein
MGIYQTTRRRFPEDASFTATPVNSFVANKGAETEMGNWKAAGRHSASPQVKGPIVGCAYIWRQGRA